jgi:hypothetical protein
MTMRIPSLATVEEDLREADRLLAEEPDQRLLRLWERIRIPTEVWAQQQYPGVPPFWVVALMGRRCVYLNPVEGGWGWGGYERMGEVSTFHWQQDDIVAVVGWTLMTINEVGFTSYP